MGGDVAFLSEFQIYLCFFTGRVLIDKSSLKYVTITSPRDGLVITDHLVDIQHVTVTGAQSNCISFNRYAHPQPIVIKDVKISDCRSHGMYFTFQYRSRTQPSEINISDCEIEDCNRGIYINRNQIAGQPKPKTVISRCSFQNLRGDGIFETHGSPAVISDCTFTRTAAVLSSRNTDKVEFKKNQVVQCGNINNRELISLNTVDNVTIEDNEFRGNVGRYRQWIRDRYVIYVVLGNSVEYNVKENITIVRTQNIQVITFTL